MDFKILKIPLGDVDAVTDKTVKFRGPMSLLHVEKGIDDSAQIRLDDLLKHREEQASFAEGEIANMCVSWDQPQWDEVDWSRIKELMTRDLLEYRKQEAVKAQQAHCVECPNFVQHVSDNGPPEVL